MIMCLGIQITDTMSWAGVAQLQLVLRACYHLTPAPRPEGKMSSADAHPLPITVVGLLQAPGEPVIFTVINTCEENNFGEDLKSCFSRLSATPLHKEHL